MGSLASLPLPLGWGDGGPLQAVASLWRSLSDTWRWFWAAAALKHLFPFLLWQPSPGGSPAEISPSRRQLQPPLSAFVWQSPALTEDYLVTTATTSTQPSATVPPAICMIFLCLPTYSWYSLKTPGNKSRSQDSFPVLSPLWVRHRSGATGTWEFGFIAQRCCLIALGSLRVQILYLWMTWSKWSKRFF